jgi:hypothetical protein
MVRQSCALKREESRLRRWDRCPVAGVAESCVGGNELGDWAVPRTTSGGGGSTVPTTNAALYFSQQPLGGEWFGNDAAGSGNAELGESRRGIPRHENDGHIGMRDGKRLHQLDAIQSRHDDVRHDEIRWGAAVLADLERLRTIGGLEDGDAFALEYPSSEAAYRGLVIDHKHGDVGTISHRRGVRKLVECLHSWLVRDAPI